ncbi:MAG: DUF2442 domain-containing protein [Kiritimatiellae bacterium]|nr:DUF2442 domain-containing protein [Kiritimatiellia bacterium]
MASRSSISQKQHHHVESVDFAEDSMILIVDGEEYRFALEVISPALATANDTERKDYRISASGYGIHWEQLDEDLSIDALLGIKHSPNKMFQSMVILRESDPEYPNPESKNTE